MRKLLALVSFLLGVCAGVGGEFLIPERYQISLTHGCVKSNVTGNVFMPGVDVYQQGQPYPYPLFSPSLNWRSYEVAWDLYSGYAERLPSEECNALVEKAIERRDKEGY